MAIFRNRSQMTQEEEKELLYILAEMQRRKLEIPEELNPFAEFKFELVNGYFPKYDGTIYNPTDNQENFIKSNARFLLFVGGRGSGKTGAGAQKTLLKIMQGESGAVMNPDFENFRYSTWAELRRWIPMEAVVPSQRYRLAEQWHPHKPFTLNFMNGASLYCKGLKNPDSARGPNINFVWYDEGGRDLEGLGWQIAIASVRIGNDPQAWVTATPSGKEHWMYKFFIKQEITEDAKEEFAKLEQPMMEVFKGSILDNQKNLDPAFFASMLAAYPDGWLRMQELQGEFVERGGVLGNPAWFHGKILNDLPEFFVKNRVRYWDLAASERKLKKGRKGYTDPDESVGTKMSYGDNRFYIEDQVGGEWEYAELKANIWNTALKDGHMTSIYLEEEPGSGGKNQIAAIKEWMKEQSDKHDLPYFKIEAYRPDTDRVILANVWFAEASKGHVYMIRGEWNDKFLSQLGSFPIAQHDDRITSTTGARVCVAPIITWEHIKFLSV